MKIAVARYLCVLLASDTQRRCPPTAPLDPALSTRVGSPPAPAPAPPPSSTPPPRVSVADDANRSPCFIGLVPRSGPPRPTSTRPLLLPTPPVVLLLTIIGSSDAVLPRASDNCCRFVRRTESTPVLLLLLAPVPAPRCCRGAVSLLDVAISRQLHGDRRGACCGSMIQTGSVLCYWVFLVIAIAVADCKRNKRNPLPPTLSSPLSIAL